MYMCVYIHTHCINKNIFYGSIMFIIESRTIKLIRVIFLISSTYIPL